LFSVGVCCLSRFHAPRSLAHSLTHTSLHYSLTHSHTHSLTYLPDLTSLYHSPPHPHMRSQTLQFLFLFLLLTHSLTHSLPDTTHSSTLSSPHTHSHTQSLNKKLPQRPSRPINFKSPPRETSYQSPTPSLPHSHTPSHTPSHNHSHTHSLTAHKPPITSIQTNKKLNQTKQQIKKKKKKTATPHNAKPNKPCPHSFTTLLNTTSPEVQWPQLDPTVTSYMCTNYESCMQVHIDNLSKYGLKHRCGITDHVADIQNRHISFTHVSE
jgi:hypothetical protein